MANENNGHRQRLRERMIKEGLQSFQDHEILEMLLFQYLPRQDTNKLAHRLLDKFGSFSNVLDASPQQLMQVDGISKVTACNLSMLKEVWNRYQRSSVEKVCLNSIGEIINLCKQLLEYCNYEKLIVVYVDFNTNYITKEEYSSNSTDYVYVEPRQIISTAMQVNASGIVLLHSHGCGPCAPSDADLEYTAKLCGALATVDVAIVEHVIINNRGETFSFYLSGDLRDMQTKVKSKL